MKEFEPEPNEEKVEKQTFPMRRMYEQISMYHRDKVSIKAAITLSETVGYLVKEILDISVEIVKNKNKKQITPEIILEAIRSDHELCELFKDKYILSEDGKNNLRTLDEVGRGIKQEIEKRIQLKKY